MRKIWSFGLAATLGLLPVPASAKPPRGAPAPNINGIPTQNAQTYLEDPVLSPGQARIDNTIEWAPEMGRVPLDIAEGALAKGLKSATAVIRCHVTVLGSMGECTLLSESPRDSGVGQAALATSAQYLVRPLLRGGKPVEALIDIVVPWAPPQGGNVGTVIDKGDMTVNTHTTYARVRWTDSPSYEDILAVLPARTKAANVGGAVILRCALTDTGAINGCRVTSETPAGYGFGNAALALANRFKAPTQTTDGKSVKGSWVTLNVLFPPGMGDGSATSVSSVQWLNQPTNQQWTSVYPPRARATNLASGSATLSCTIAVDGGLKACGVKDETPAGSGFGAAAMAATPVFVAKVWNDDGEAMIGRTVTFPLTFETKNGAMRASIGEPVKP